jgi:ankyrin repeat protein
MLVILLLFAQIGHKQEMLSPSELLHRAAMRGETSAIEMLLKLGADVNSTDQHGKTALHDASLKGHVDTARLLLDRGAKIGARDKNGGTPLHDAALGGSAKAIELLLGRHADINARDSDGLTPLDYALKMERPDAIRVLRAFASQTTKNSSR